MTIDMDALMRDGGKMLGIALVQIVEPDTLARGLTSAELREAALAVIAAIDLPAIIRKRAGEIERLKLDIRAQECLQDSAYRAGMKAGWNCRDADDNERFNAAMQSNEHIRELRNVQREREELEKRNG